MSVESLIGVWHLVSFVRLDGNGAVAALPRGENPRGMLIYTADGRMSVHLMNGGRARFDGIAQDEGTVEEKAEALNTYQGYAGTFELAGSRVTHHITLSSFPNWVGESIWRDVELDGDRLVLSAPYRESAGEPRKSVLVWQRA